MPIENGKMSIDHVLDGIVVTIPEGDKARKFDPVAIKMPDKKERIAIDGSGLRTLLSFARRFYNEQLESRLFLERLARESKSERQQEEILTFLRLTEKPIT